MFFNLFLFITSLFLFFSKGILIFLFFNFSLFLFFLQNYYHFTKGKEPARSPKPAVSFPLNPFLLGHGLGFYPKNPPTSEKKVSSVSYEQIRVAIFFITTCHPERCASSYALASKNDSGSHFIFFQKVFDYLSFLISSLFLLFHKKSK